MHRILDIGNMMIGGNFGKYQILSIIGKGSMGVVFLAEEPDGKKIALKLISTSEDAQEDLSVARLRFNRESKYAMELQHPNIVKTFHTGEIDNTLYLACELVEAGSLEEMMTKGSLSELVSLKIAKQVLQALSKINEYKLVHRDIKPGNVLIAKDGIVKLSDLGLIRSTSSDRTMLTQQDNVVGTPYYLAPEQIHSPEEVDIRCDLYAVGIMLYECIAGHLPFNGDNLVEILKQHLYSPVPEIENEKIRKEVFNFICELLAKKARKRPASPEKALIKIEKLIRFYGKNIEDNIPVLQKEEKNFTSSKICHITLLGSTKERMSKAKLCVKCNGERNTTFVYGGDVLFLGRNSTSENNEHVCLRLRPAKGNEKATRKISGLHCKIFCNDEKNFLVDTRSTFGTKLDGQKAQANIPVEIQDKHELEIANVLNLRLHKVFREETIYEIEGEGQSVPQAAIFIERPINGVEHLYALIPSSLKLGLANNKLIPKNNGIIELIHMNNTLWLRNPNKEKCYALSPGTFNIGNATITVSHISPEDQK